MVAGSMYLVQTVSNTRRPWSSYTDVRTNGSEGISYKVVRGMNGNMYSPMMSRRMAGASYDFPEKEVKKEKKWSFGNIFRRKKKNVSESTSEEDNKTGFLQRRKKKKKKSKQAQGVFDHVVIPHNVRGSYNTLDIYRNNEDATAIFSDPTFNVSNKNNIHHNNNKTNSNQYLSVNYQGSDRSDVNVSRNSLASVESVTKKNRKEIAKARAEARRENLKCNSSSDEESQRSGSSAAKFRSDESLSKYSSLSKRSRSARTERYMRRLSKDEEFRDPKFVYRTDLENGRLKTRSPYRNQENPIPYYNSYDPSGMLTIPPSHNNNKRNRNFTVTTCCFDNVVLNNRYAETNPPVTNSNQRSLSYESNIDNQIHSDIVQGRLPLGIPVYPNEKTPPLPPPRDPRRVVTMSGFDSSRPNSYCLETAIETKNGFARNRSPLVLNDKRMRNISDITGMYSQNFRSASQDQIPLEPVVHSLTVRPASTTPNQEKENEFSMFLTDSQPRSRKPLSVHSFVRSENNNLNNGRSKASQTYNFWRQKEDEVKRHKSEPLTKILPKSPTPRHKSPVLSSKSCTAFTTKSPILGTKSPVINNKVDYDEIKSDVPHCALLVNAVAKSPIEKSKKLSRVSSPFRPISPEPKVTPNPLNLNRSKSMSPGLNFRSNSYSPNSNSKKPENLEDALNELEEIYNSLRLGDEDLLDRAGKREDDICKEVATNVLSCNKRKRFVSSRSADVKQDDLAFRKYCKERSKTIGDPHSVTSSISYLLASPLSGDLLDLSEIKHRNKKEPDITYDDLVYRNIKQTNNTLKILDPQPPFGIPIGPISSAPNSDYLHADPEVGRLEKVSKKIPDIVKDDLAYRSLRKDHNKEPALPPSSPIGDANNNKMYILPLSNNKFNPNNSLKKKRAVRSLSANMFNLMQNEHNERMRNELEIAQSLTEIADAMEQTRMMLKEQDKNITETRKGFLSDGEALYSSQRSPRLEAIKRSRAYFLDDMKSFEIPKLPPNFLRNNDQDDKEDANTNSKTLDELLTALAVETRETSDRITNELRMLDEEDILKKTSPVNVVSNETEKVTLDETPALSPEEPVEDLYVKNCNPTEDQVDIDVNGNHQVSEDDDDVMCEIPSVVEEITVAESKDTSDEIPVELITKTLSDDSNDKAEHAKMCEKLLECVILENADIVSDEVESDYVDELDEKSVASIVLTPKDEDALVAIDPIEIEVHSEPDYENLKYVQDVEENDQTKANLDNDDNDLNEKLTNEDEIKNGNEDDIVVVKKEDKEETVLDDEDDDEMNKAFHSDRKESKGQALVSRSSRNKGADPEKETRKRMCEKEEGKAERMAKYKEERRKQLAFQFEHILHPFDSSKKRQNNQNCSSSSDEPRTTRASRLRAAAAALTATDNQNGNRNIKKERSPAFLSSGCESPGSSSKPERDKSSKRKSNLNRAHTSEEVPPDLYNGDDNLSRRRRRRFFPSEVVEQAKEALTLNDDKNNKINNDTACITSPTSSISATSPRPRSPSKKSVLSIHMENARKGILPSYSEMGKYHRPSPPKTATINTKEKYKPFSTVENELSHNNIDKNKSISKLDLKENIKQVSKTDTNIVNKKESCNKLVVDYQQPEKLCKLNNVSKKMDELTALARQTLARVEKLSHASSITEAKVIEIKSQSENAVSSTSSSHHNIHKKQLPTKLSDEERRPPSILKKKSSEESSESISAPIVSVANAPVSILKRKSSHEDHKVGYVEMGPPVTFSPNVVDPVPTRKQGILKKRRSLDESHVQRQRSCSPLESFSNGKQESKSILKDQRRSSLEMIRCKSPDGLQSILKRKNYRNEDDVQTPLNSPELQGILKRRSGVHSAGSNSNAPHVSITTAVILAAAGGAEMVLETNEMVKPILKKKSSEEQSFIDPGGIETPKPILKKKSGSERDSLEEKPKKPILKHSRSSYEDKDSSDNSEVSKLLKDDEFEMKPILKQPSRENSPRPRLSFCENDSYYNNLDDSVVVIRRNKMVRRSYTVSTNEDVENVLSKRKDEEMLNEKNERPVSVCEMIRNLEKNIPSITTGAVPKRTSINRKSDRYHTQPITYSELEASLSSFQKSCVDELSLLSSSSSVNNSNQKESNFKHDVYSLLDFTTEENNYIPSKLNNLDYFDSGYTKMSTDSAFQSLGDGLELEQEELKTSPPKSPIAKSLSKGQLQMKSLAEEAKAMALKRVGSNASKYRTRRGVDSLDKASSSRFSTQPITTEEVQEAAKMTPERELDESDPANLSLSERIKFFTMKCIENGPSSRPLPVRRRNSRFSTQPVTSEELISAKTIIPASTNANNIQKCNGFVLGDHTTSDQSLQEPKGILKSKSYALTVSPELPPFLPKSVLKKREKDTKSVANDTRSTSPSSLRPILKQESLEIARDEGISSDETDSDVDVAIGKNDFGGKITSPRLSFNNNDDEIQTSDGESSGGREIRNILSRDPSFKKRRSQELYGKENWILKSHSQSHFHNEEIEQEQQQVAGLRRSLTQSAMPQTIAELQAKLQKSGDSDWRKRIPRLNNTNEELNLLNVKNRYNDELNEKISIKARKEELGVSSTQWRKRIEPSDSVNFSVLGRMQKTNDEIPIISINLPKLDEGKRTPKAKIFKGRLEENCQKISSVPVSPEKTHKTLFTRSVSSPTGRDLIDATIITSNSSVRKVQVIRPDDATFKSFFESIDNKKLTNLEPVSIDDLDCVVRESDNLLVHKRDIKFRRRHETKNNPIKVLASRTDIKDEYTEVITGVAEREKKRQNIEKLAKNSTLATEALAGLASKEDFAAVSLKKSSSFSSSHVPFKDTMLIHVKGRRHVQTRLVEPKIENVNEGDSYILIKGNTIYSYTGSFSNIIEQSRASDIINHIKKTGDLGCKAPKLVTVNGRKSYNSADSENFWKIVDSNDSNNDVTGAGHPDEDEIYENSIISTNMIYEFKNEELVPLQEYWGGMPKIKMLETNKVFVFDFGTEMYVWSGKNASLEDKRKALNLAKELWNEGYNYVDCHVSPLNVASMLGSREKSNIPLKNNSRPEWALFAKLTQHRETILFREKFLDWPDYSRVIKVKAQDEKNVDASFDLKRCDVEKMLNSISPLPNLDVDGLKLGRGKSYFDEETNRLFQFTTLDITCWIILEYSQEKIDRGSVGQFFNGNSYIVRWQYRATVTGRELSGKPSKYAQVGRDRCVYFCWQGNSATINEKGAAALLTIELDSENARQIRVVQGQEPPAFLNLFDGSMVIHDGKYENEKSNNSSRLFISRGEIDNETVLTELPCTMRSLRSRASFLLIDGKSEILTVWHGRKSTKQTRKVTEQSVQKIIENNPKDFGFNFAQNFAINVVEEGKETDEFLKGLGGENRQLYDSLEKCNETYDYTPRLFHLTSISGSFEANQVSCPHRSDRVTPYPFLQSDLYSASQPALFLFDNNHELWLWQGWWPPREDDIDDLSDQTGSGAVRWQAERKAAMETALEYYKCKHPNSTKIEANLVWSGLEPFKFTNLFPFWTDKDDIAELNIKEGRKAGDFKSIETELALLTQETYPLSQILQRPLPEGVDPTQLEKYLSSDDFLELTSVSIEEFQKLPAWKQTAIKKEKGLF